MYFKRFFMFFIVILMFPRKIVYNCLQKWFREIEKEKKVVGAREEGRSSGEPSLYSFL